MIGWPDVSMRIRCCVPVQEFLATGLFLDDLYLHRSDKWMLLDNGTQPLSIHFFSSKEILERMGVGLSKYSCLFLRVAHEA